MSPRSIAKAVKRTTGNARVYRSQARTLARHDHAVLEDVVARFVLDHVGKDEEGPLLPARMFPDRLSVGVATPWAPQRTGVADFSTAVFTELAHHVDLTVYTTADAEVGSTIEEDVKIEHRNVDEVLSDPVRVAGRHDAFISVVGNSHYHLPYVDLLSRIDAIAIAHDTRMVEYYMALRGKGGLEQVMLTSADPSAPSMIAPPLDDQIDDMRLLQNAGFWEIAHRAKRLVLHSPSAAPRIRTETGVEVHVLPFANQRVPDIAVITIRDREQARIRLGLDKHPAGTIHLASFGYVDARTKMTDVVVEAAAWLMQWGRSVALHLVGHASDAQRDELIQRAHAAGVTHFQITGFQSEEQFRDWLLAVDAGVQLRISPVLGVSGPLSDLAAFGTPAVASSGLCVDVDTPAYIHRLPDAVSPVIVAEAIEELLANPMPDQELEAAQWAYLTAKTPAHYATLLLEQIRAGAS